MQWEEKPTTFKIVITGDAAVGKTQIINRFAENGFEEKYDFTMGVDFKMKTVEKDGLKCKIQMWDTAGQKQFNSGSLSYYRNAKYVMIVYDITNKESFDNVKTHFNAAKEAESTQKCILVGNKSDQAIDRKVSWEEGNEVAKATGMQFFETSAKESTNVEEAFVATVG